MVRAQMQAARGRRELRARLRPRLRLLVNLLHCAHVRAACASARGSRGERARLSLCALCSRSVRAVCLFQRSSVSSRGARSVCTSVSSNADVQPPENCLARGEVTVSKVTTARRRGIKSSERKRYSKKTIQDDKDALHNKKNSLQSLSLASRGAGGRSTLSFQEVEE